MFWTASGVFVLNPGEVQTYRVSWFRRLDAGDHGPQWILPQPLLFGRLTTESVSKEFGIFPLPNPDDVGDGIGVSTSGTVYAPGWWYYVTIRNDGTTTVLFILQGGGVVFP